MKKISILALAMALFISVLPVGAAPKKEQKSPDPKFYIYLCKIGRAHV